MIYYDVEKYEDLPSPPSGQRFLDCVSEPKGLRCYLVPADLPRGKFLEDYEDILDERLKPIYKYKGVCVRQDSSFFVPAFYIVHPVSSVTALDFLDELTNIRTFFILRVIRKAMRDVLGIHHIHMYYHEKLHKNGDVHYSLLPLYNITKDDILLRFDLMKYVKKFIFSEEKDKILEFNCKVRAYLDAIELKKQDEALINRLRDCR
ncbi:MAG: hypothetical protein KGR16_05270 [Verrucomicrobia bacterium]|nr:hypothetical protein [Verrucomicrobiota bacterium]